MDNSPLIASLEHSLDANPATSICVAYSGGADSTALLHALAQLSQARARGLRALHVDHGLHKQSAQWAEHCRRFCAALQVPIELATVQVNRERGDGLEAAARRARYAAFSQSLRSDEWLALAHHRDDQVETVLLKLLRGAGPHGLGGMREQRPFAAGTLWRPLLDIPRAALLDYVNQHGPTFIDDPSNADISLSRNYLRSEILPRLHTHWPQASQSIVHTASLCRSAASQLDLQTESSLRDLVRPDGSFDAAGWCALPEALFALVLEHWLHGQGLPAPTHAQCTELRRQACASRPGHMPRVAWHGAQVNVWRGALYAMAPSSPIAADWEAIWTGAPLQLPGGGSLALVDIPSAPSASLLHPPLRVRFRQGGEHIRPAGDPHTRELRDLLQRAAIPPWQRASIPLVFRDDELLAVADLWSSDAGRTMFKHAGGRILWQRPIDSAPTLR